MTREEIKDELYRMLSDVVNGGYPKRNNAQRGRYREAVKEAIKALEQEPCEDAISREAVLSKIKEVCFSEEWLQFRVDKGSNGQRDFLIDYIEQLPSITPQPKTGHWITTQNEVFKYYCDKCGTGDNLRTNYCPNCGAKMEGKK